MEQSRLKSPVLWMAVAALVSLVLKSWFNYEIPNFDNIIESLLYVLGLFGVLNNPVNKTGF